MDEEKWKRPERSRRTRRRRLVTRSGRGIGREGKQKRRRRIRRRRTMKRRKG